MISSRDLDKVKARLARVPYFEHPSHFDENGKNTYYGNKNMAGENHVFMTVEDFIGENSQVVSTKDKFNLVFEDDNVGNKWNRQYIETEDGGVYDNSNVWDFNVGDRYKSSKIAKLFDFEDFCTYLSANKHDKVLKKLLTIDK